MFQHKIYTMTIILYYSIIYHNLARLESVSSLSGRICFIVFFISLCMDEKTAL